MSFIQKFFTSRGNRSDGESRVGELDRLWYDSNTNTIRIGDGTPGGKIVSGSGLGSNVHESANPPTMPPPVAGDLWWQTDDGRMYIYYDNTWVDTNPVDGKGINLTDLSVTTDTATVGGSLSFNNSNGVFTFAPALKDRIVSPNNLHSAIIDNTGTTTFGGDIVPGATTYTLGTVDKPWKDIYVSQGSIIIADNDPAVDGVSIRNTDKYIVIDQGGLKVTANDGTHEVFQLDSTGKLILKSEQPLLTSTPAVSLVGNLSGNQLPTTNLGVMLQATGTQDQPSRIYIDGVGTYNSANAYPAFVGRAARGTADNPLPIQAGDTIARFGGNAYGSTVGLNSISNTRMDLVATETQSNTNRGSRIDFWTTPIGSAAPSRSLHIDSDGIDLSEAANSGAGIIFKNGSELKYWPAVAGNNGKILRTDGTNFFWANETVVTGQVIFKGDWSAANPPGGGTPTISDATGSAGWQYIVNAAGTQNLGSGNITFAIGDLVIHNSTRYVRIQGSTAQVQANWTETNSGLPAFIQNKPTLATVATSGSYADLTNKPTIPAAQVNSDWNATTGLAQILNKPSIPTQYTDTLARGAISLTNNTPSGTTSTLTYVGGVFTFTSAAAPTAPVNADWNATTGLAQILNKPSIPAAQIQSDWTQSNNASADYIKNKPTLTNGTVTSVGGTGTVSGLTLTGTVTSTGNLTLGGTLSGITNTNLSGTAGITNANLANSTISGVSLGNNLYNLTAGTGITFSSGTTYNGSAAITINNSITQYTDALARAAHSAGTGISYNSSTGVISSTITQYTDALARSAISVSGSLSYNSSTGVVSYTTPTYTVTTASASGGGALSLTGTTFTFTPASIPSYGVGGNQLVFVLDAVLNLASAKNTLASIFGLTNGVTVTSNTRYQYELVFNVQANKTGVLSYALALGSSAAVAQHNYSFEGNTTTTIVGYTAGVSMMSANATGAAITTAQTVADTLNGFAHYIVCGTIDVTTGGTVNFMISQDQNTPITWSVKPGAYVKLTPLGAIGANTAAGTWA